MSKIGKQPILIPEAVKADIKLDKVSISGPKGELEFKLPEGIKVEQKNRSLVVRRDDEKKQTKAFHGLARSILSNMVKGVAEGFSKTLELKGIGFSAAIEGGKLILKVGFSHPVEIAAPPEIEINQQKNQLIISGIDKQKVGEFAAKIRAIKPPEPYKGKGIRYLGETVRIKPGKQQKGPAS